MASMAGNAYKGYSITTHCSGLRIPTDSPVVPTLYIGTFAVRRDNGVGRCEDVCCRELDDFYDSADSAEMACERAARAYIDGLDTSH